jgi:hypothetical protein
MDMAPVVAAGIALAGTLAATGVGYLQWRKSHASAAEQDAAGKTRSDEERQERYLLAREDALRRIWEALMAFERTLRNTAYYTGRIEPLQGLLEPSTDARSMGSLDRTEKPFDRSSLMSGAREIRLLSQELAPFLLEEERSWIEAFITDAVEVHTAITEAETADEQWWAQTLTDPGNVSRVSQAATEMMEVSNRLAERYASVVRRDK